MAKADMAECHLLDGESMVDEFAVSASSGSAHQFDRYSEYQQSGVEALGEIPAHWKLKPLKYVLQAPLAYGVLKPDRYDGDDGIPLIRILDVESGEVRQAWLQRISPAQSREYRRTVLNAGDLIVSVVGTIGRSFVVPQSLAGANLSRALARIQLTPEVDARFLEYCIVASAFESFVEMIPAGTAQRVLNLGDLAQFVAAVPSPAEQDAIVRFLDREMEKIDGLVAKKEELIRLLQEKRAALITHAVTKGLDLNAPMKDSGIEWIGEIPADWKIRRLSTVCGFQSGKAHEPYVVEDGEFVCVNARFVSTEGKKRKFCSRNLSPAKRNDVLMVMSDLPNGRALARTFFVTENDRYAVNQRVCIISAQQVNPRFLFYYLDRSPFFLCYDDGLNQTHLPNAAFTKCPVLLPPPREQVAISEYLDLATNRINGLIKKVEDHLTLLQELRTALISAAVTGKIDVREEVA